MVKEIISAAAQFKNESALNLMEEPIILNMIVTKIAEAIASLSEPIATLISLISHHYTEVVHQFEVKLIDTQA